MRPIFSLISRFFRSNDVPSLHALKLPQPIQRRETPGTRPEIGLDQRTPEYDCLSNRLLKSFNDDPRSSLS